MMKVLLSQTKRPTKRLLFSSVLVHSLVISSRMILDLDHVMAQNQMDKFLLSIKSSVMLKSKRQFSLEATSKVLLVWPIQLLLRKTSSQSSMRLWIKSYLKITYLHSIWPQNKPKELVSNPIWHLDTMIKRNSRVTWTGMTLSTKDRKSVV